MSAPPEEKLFIRKANQPWFLEVWNIQQSSKEGKGSKSMTNDQ